MIFSILAGHTLDIANESAKLLPFVDRPVDHHEKKVQDQEKAQSERDSHSKN